jgi:hypothetical protein
MSHLTYLTAKPLRAALAGALAFALPVALVAPVAPAAAQSAASQLDQVVAALRGIGTMTADFTQTDRKGQTVRGTSSTRRASTCCSSATARR